MESAQSHFKEKMLHNLYILESFALIHPTKKVQNFLFLMIDHLLRHIGKNFIWVCSNTSISDLSFLLSFASTYFHHFSLNFLRKIEFWHFLCQNFDYRLTCCLFIIYRVPVLFFVVHRWNKKVHVVSIYLLGAKILSTFTRIMVFSQMSFSVM